MEIYNLFIDRVTLKLLMGLPLQNVKQNEGVRKSSICATAGPMFVQTEGPPGGTDPFKLSI
ncbi:hypothetical protein D3C77_810640 [compost metagenome]